jgi:hypothetical protein
MSLHLLSLEFERSLGGLLICARNDTETETRLKILPGLGFNKAAPIHVWDLFHPFQADHSYGHLGAWGTDEAKS